VCLLNGLAMHTKAWYGFLPMLTDEYDVILYDFLGQGESSKEDIPYFIDELARYLALIMDELGVEKVHPMGISYGGFIALEFARLYPERLHTLDFLRAFRGQYCRRTAGDHEAALLRPLR
jgi:2-succinyl-6-hydroxy-2,4-cyclohexadiene-1-carboxylate synthase